MPELQQILLLCCFWICEEKQLSIDLWCQCIDKKLLGRVNLNVRGGMVIEVYGVCSYIICKRVCLSFLNYQRVSYLIVNCSPSCTISTLHTKLPFNKNCFHHSRLSHFGKSHQQMYHEDIDGVAGCETISQQYSQEWVRYDSM